MSSVETHALPHENDKMDIYKYINEKKRLCV